ncbi:DUF1553 domain-containing protein [Lewinella sp. W8]|nr:DUF1553 domain-containing protein [Lewinella sp. W8]
MRFWVRRWRLFLVGLSLLWLGGCGHQPTVSFNEDIRPIFNERCVSCHGGVKQSGGFGLVFRENALKETASGKFAIVPGKPGQSELLKRIRHDNPEWRMPLEEAPLTNEEADLIERWIWEGAAWAPHWAYQPPREIAPEERAPHGHNLIDDYVYGRLVGKDLAPAPRAQKSVLLRRLSLDLTGLPPSPALMEDFLQDDTPGAYQRMVDSLLNATAFGERWASMWLDLARYADSRGYERDRDRSIWQYRDWVIDAFNQDLPFDRFTIEQLAGDLLNESNDNNLIATAFHRNTLSNGEGGTENEEYRVAAVIDRVNTTWEVWQGTTMSCVQCHSHPYDPIKHEDFYRSYDFFNQTLDHDHVSEFPSLITHTKVNQAKLENILGHIAIAGDGAQVQAWRDRLLLQEPRWRPHSFTSVQNAVFTDRADEDYLFVRNGAQFQPPTPDIPEVAALHLSYRARTGADLTVHLDRVDGPVIGSLRLSDRSWQSRTDVIPLTTNPGTRPIFLTFSGQEGPILADVYGIHYQPPLPDANAPATEEVREMIVQLLNTRDSVRTPVMVEAPPAMRRTTHLFVGGNWLVHGPPVRAGIPKVFSGLDQEETADRLALAHWLVSDNNPLTSRVTVNRIWAQLFGRGIVATLSDFGSQGAPPSHPELLDHLAVRFREDFAWSLKALLRYIVSSATYQQSSSIDPELYALDPDNVYLARGPRLRLSAEQIRDQMLAQSGLLSRKMYGPGVMPPQPDGLWDAIPYSGRRWVTSTGEDRYRRSVYTYLRRSVPFPGLTTFDGPNREFCLSQRTTTNTPLQALHTLNDPIFQEGAALLARELMTEFDDPRARIDGLFQRLLFRKASSLEQQQLLDLFMEARGQFQRQENQLNPEIAAMTLVVNTVFNLDEYLSKT